MLFLVDGDGLLYRAANAIPYFTNAHGLPTNGLHGFAAMMWRLRRMAEPSHMAVAFTGDPPLVKHRLDPDYKVNHYEHPEEIKRQMPYAMRFVKGLGVGVFLEQGYEADDVIATLLQQHHRMHARIVSSDRDFYQLVSDRARVLAPVRGVSEMRDVGPAEVKAMYGIMPSQIPDLKALTGDPSDDIPGVGGIGPKTAAALLREFPTVEALLANLDRVNIPGVRLRLEPMHERILLNKQLATPLVVRYQRRQKLAVAPPRRRALRALADETGVGSISPSQA
ncbi:MAG: 5'-3' exonuclease [Bacillati bacterium ANGP1]|uniref:5'-3' exonuclease n=1 Tax=Candidatus Segetimicrobium genomatis TaxID=2569760 RepID=A0A537IRA0_9BACT|nr:MAG: 5'-3' exonuclease [Terrabacteria group bacterium ANGP1]